MLLLDSGASTALKTSKGQTVWDLCRHTQKSAILSLLPIQSNSTSIRSSISHRPVPSLTDYSDPEEDSDVSFDWNSCRPDQMIVFNEETVDAVLRVVISHLFRQNDIPTVVSANIIFLCARFAHYHNPPEVLDRFMAKTFNVIESKIQSHAGHVDDTRLLGQWIANCHHLLYFLKRDEGLRNASFQYQATFSDMIVELAERLLKSLRKAMAELMETCLVGFIDDDERGPHVQMESVLGIFTGAGKRNNSIVRKTGGLLSSIGISTVLSQHTRTPSISSPASIGGFFGASAAAKANFSSNPRTPLPSPHIFIKFLKTTRDTLSESRVHGQIIHQIFHNLFRYLNNDLFNRIISSTDLVARSQASRIRSNLNEVLEWLEMNQELVGASQKVQPGAKNNLLPSLPYAELKVLLTPTLHLLQFAEAITRTPTLFDFLSLKSHTPSLNTAQIRRAMCAYRFEVGEPNFAESVEVFVVREWEEVSHIEKSNCADENAEGSGFVEMANNELVEFLDAERIIPVQIPTVHARDGEVDGDLNWEKMGMVLIPVVPSEVLSLLDA
ncbi:hypothetical protein HDU98_008623 [Podochytrium sp. JEL0797]|nr:hypothetical protein HDU98_008623 [Podochytrium sp. JEL0797]